jgi:hypothetical protein
MNRPWPTAAKALLAVLLAVLAYVVWTELVNPGSPSTSELSDENSLRSTAATSAQDSDSAGQNSGAGLADPESASDSARQRIGEFSDPAAEELPSTQFFLPDGRVVSDLRVYLPPPFDKQNPLLGDALGQVHWPPGMPSGTTALLISEQSAWTQLKPELHDSTVVLSLPIRGTIQITEAHSKVPLSGVHVRTMLPSYMYKYHPWVAPTLAQIDLPNPTSNAQGEVAIPSYLLHDLDEDDEDELLFLLDPQGNSKFPDLAVRLFDPLVFSSDPEVGEVVQKLALLYQETEVSVTFADQRGPVEAGLEVSIELDEHARKLQRVTDAQGSIRFMLALDNEEIVLEHLLLNAGGGLKVFFYGTEIDDLDNQLRFDRSFFPIRGAVNGWAQRAGNRYSVATGLTTEWLKDKGIVGLRFGPEVASPQFLSWTPVQESGTFEIGSGFMVPTSGRHLTNCLILKNETTGLIEDACYLPDFSPNGLSVFPTGTIVIESDVEQLAKEFFLSLRGTSPRGIETPEFSLWEKSDPVHLFPAQRKNLPPGHYSLSLTWKEGYFLVDHFEIESNQTTYLHLPEISGQEIEVRVSGTLSGPLGGAVVEVHPVESRILFQTGRTDPDGVAKLNIPVMGSKSLVSANYPVDGWELSEALQATVDQTGSEAELEFTEGRANFLLEGFGDDPPEDRRILIYHQPSSHNLKRSIGQELDYSLVLPCGIYRAHIFRPDRGSTWLSEAVKFEILLNQETDVLLQKKVE